MSVRECGDSRTDGGVYIEGPGYAPGGRPVEDFLVDPPRPINLDDYGITPVGQHLVEFDGVYHVADVVGEKYYPYPWDYVREVGHGSAVSRKTSLAPAQLGLLTPGRSRLMLLHRKAFLANRHDLVAQLDADQGRRADTGDGCGWSDFACPQHQTAHARELLAGWLSDPARTGDALPCCVGLWEFAHDVPGVTHANKRMKADPRITRQDDAGNGWTRLTRRLACGAEYTAFGHNTFTPRWDYAIFAVFPITNLVVVDPQGRHDDKVQAVNAAAQFDVQAVSE